MPTRNPYITLVFSVFLCVQSLIFAVSLAPGLPEADPFSSQSLLREYDFDTVLSESERSAADNLLIQLATMGKGDPLYVWFGHSALVVSDLRNNRSVMYDYGIFSFDDDFYQTFAMGRLFYEVWATSANARYDLAIDEDRDLRVITLDLPPEGKLALVKFLNFNILPENQTYLYHHYNENCATRLRDIIDKAVGGQFKTWAQSTPSPYTIREHVMRHSYSSPFVDWVLNYLQSGRIDAPISLWEAMFLPAVLEEAIREFSYTTKTGEIVRLMLDSEVLNIESTQAGRTPVLETYQSMTLPSAGFGLGIGIITLLLSMLFLRSHTASLIRTSHILLGTINWLWTFFVGICSTVLLFMMLFTSHDVTYGNENIVFANPWLLVMSFWSLQILFGSKKALLRFKRSCSWLSIITLCYILLKAMLPDLLIQQNWQILLTMLPLYILNSNFSFSRLIKYLNQID